jgi:hypothetical protein
MRKPQKTVKDVLSQEAGLKNVFTKTQQMLKMKVQLANFLPLELQAECRLANYRDGILIMQANSSIWATRLRMLSPHLLRRLQSLDMFHDLQKIDIKVKPPEMASKKGLNHATLSPYGKTALAQLKYSLAKSLKKQKQEK